MAENKEYTSESIRVLEGLEAVRKRPGMYIGSTGPQGLHHMIWEIVDNSIDEAMGGFASTIILTLKKDGSIRVEDDGRGIPIDVHPKTGKSTVETVLTVLHAGGKFDNSSYKISGGLHGVGASVVNGLSKWMKVWVCRKNEQYYVEFHDGGHNEKPLEKIGYHDKEHGTTIEFYPDFTVMEKAEFDPRLIKERLQQLAYLNKNIKIVFIDEISNTRGEWCYEGGVKQYIIDLNRDKEQLVDNIVYGEIEDTVKVPNSENETYSIKVEVAFQYNKTYNNSCYSFCNNIHTTEGGTHEEGFKFAIAKIINRFAVEKKFLKDTDEKCSKEDVLEGLTAIISVKHPNPQYEGQTKKKLGNTEVRTLVNIVVSEIFEKFILENPDDANLIIKKVMLAMEARRKSQEAREATRRKSPFDSGSLPGKLADCSTKDSSISELYLVEGDSAGGSAKLGRDREFQAILPLRGKILNVEKAKTERVFDSEEIIAMITAIGAGVGPEFDINKIRYNKVVIMTDADVDGAHIRILLLTFFFRYMQPLISNGNVYIARPPLYKFQINKVIKYAYTDEQLEEYKKEFAEKGKYIVQRYKGLGEMNPSQLWETTMDPSNRSMFKVTIDDAIVADKNFSLLMGDDVAPRKEFIEKNAKYVKNLDI